LPAGKQTAVFERSEKPDRLLDRFRHMILERRRFHRLDELDKAASLF
jgi:hypothetical protein